MKNFKLYLLTILASGFLFSCKKDDDTSYTPPRDYGEQYANEIIEIEEYLATHYLTGTGINAIINKIPEGGNQTPLSQHPLLNSLLVKRHEIDYKLYYIKFNEGIGQRPSQVDSVFVSYKGWLTDGTQFDYNPNSTWLSLGDRTIEGLSQTLSNFKTGNYNLETDLFENPGSGIVIIPSGLGYFHNPPSSSNITHYATLIFSFNLNTLRYRDHDGDGIQSRFEARFFNEDVEDNNENRDPRNFDSDGDGNPNYLDIDDDGDGIKTRYEIRRNTNGDIYSFENIKSCSEGAPKIHLDPNCSTPILEP